ncbi:hypothetical protein BIY27_25005 [Gibbsiella quercinecans]|uniref:hypothetical protein n=1 Tax=Gibbsiella quercinecans TaxID=929813 RepID=UPI000EF1B5FF|nr:hypothetical protein [Gibbsiella quercinecans]RLM02474.1 hypothetical protein BIY27_25005 [Gibbsiella quercinecans]
MIKYLKLITIIYGIIVLVFAITYASADYINKSTLQGFILFGTIPVAILGILSAYFIDAKGEDILSLWVRRKTLEEKKKISELSKDK